MNAMLLEPPSQAAAGHIREAVALLLDRAITLPRFPTKYTPSKITVVLHGQQSCAGIFKDMYGESHEMHVFSLFHLSNHCIHINW